MPGTTAMRTSILILLAALLAPDATAQAEPPRATERMWVLYNDDFVGDLVLDTAQHRRLIDLERWYQRSYDEVLAIDTLDDNAIRARLEDLSEQREAGIKRVMTPEQYARWGLLTRTRDGPGKTP